MGGRIKTMQLMQSLAMLTQTGTVSTEVMHGIVTKYMQKRSYNTEEVILELCKLEVPEDKMDVLALVCDTIRAKAQ